MPIVQQGQLNTTALVVPDLYVQIVPPQNLVINGVPTNVLGVVGTASWGPVNTAAIVGNMQQYAQTFGPIMARKYDMGTVVATAVQQGAQNFRCVRVTDGTDVAASSTGVATCITFTALYTGSLGNTLQASLATGSKANSYKFTVGFPGQQPEVFDNITGTGNAFWLALAAAINGGNSIQRGPSNLITATAAAGATAPSAQSFTFTGGLDGVTTLSASVLVGTDSSTGGVRKGMYVLRSQGCSVGVLADADDKTQWTTIDGFGQSEGIYMIQTAQSGYSITQSLTDKSTAGLDSYSSKLMHGDYVYWNDPVNNVLRQVTPQGFVAGLLSNLSPNNSSLNKKLFGVVATQKSGPPNSLQQQVYSEADLQTLFQAGIDVITNPAAGGIAIWAVRGGFNSSSNASINDDSYTRMTNYLAATLQAGMSVYLGQPITQSLFRNIRTTELSFLAALLQQGLLTPNADGSVPYTVVCDASNNPQSRTALGYVQSDAAVTYEGINKKFIVNVQGGATVVTMQPATSVTA